MTFNLALAPLIIAVILFPYALFHEASSGIFSIFKSLFSALFISFFCLPDLLDDDLPFPIGDSPAATPLSTV